MLWDDEDDLPDHERCEHCGGYVCRGDHPWGCVATDECLREGNTASPSHWTADGIIVHARCVPAFEKELEDDERARNTGELHA